MEGVRGEHLTPGEFRRTQNWIGPATSTIETAPYVPPPVDEMLAALGALETFIHARSDLRPLVRAGLIHYQFEAIHPFIDGNGRTGRLILNGILAAFGVEQIVVYYDDRHRYYNDIKRFRNTRWVDFTRIMGNLQ